MIKVGKNIITNRLFAIDRFLFSGEKDGTLSIYAIVPSLVK